MSTPSGKPKPSDIPPEPRAPLHEEPTCEHAEDLDAIWEEPVFRDGVLVGVRATCMVCHPDG